MKVFIKIADKNYSLDYRNTFKTNTISNFPIDRTKWKTNNSLDEKRTVNPFFKKNGSKQKLIVEPL